LGALVSDDPTLGDTTDEKAPEDWQTQARAAGYSWGDINGHVASASAAALDAGYTPQQIDSYLGYSDPAPARERFTAGFSRLFGDDPTALDGLAGGAPKLDLTQADWRGDYARSLMNGEVKGAEDFVDHYAASAVNAATTPDRLDDSNGQLRDARIAAAAASGNELVGALPPRADFVDAALSLAAPEDTKAVQENLIRHWRDTGQAPVDAALNAKTDYGLLGKLLSVGDPEATGAAEASKAIEPAVDAYMEWATKNQADSFKATQDVMELMRQGKHQEAAARLMETPAMAFVGGNIEAKGGAMAGVVASDLLAGLRRRLSIIDPEAPAGAAVQVNPAEALAPPDQLLHAEAQESALERINKLTNDRLAAERGEPAAGSPARSFASIAGDEASAQPKRPSFKLVEKPQEEGAAETAKDFEIHRDGEPVGFANVELSEDGKSAYLANIATDGRGNSLGPRAVRDLATQFFEAHPDVQEMTGIRVSGARLQSGEGATGATITRDQVLKPPPPAEVNALVEGYEAQAAVGGYFNKFFGHVLEDTSGAVPIPKWRTAAQEADRAGKIDSRDFMQKNAMEHNSWAEQTVKQVAAKLEPLRKTLNPHMAEWEGELDKLRDTGVGNPMDTMVGNLWDVLQGHSLGASLKSTSNLGPVFSELRTSNLRAEQLLRDAEKEGLITVGGYYQDYGRQMWKRPNLADDKFLGNGKAGTSGSFRERTYPTIADGLNAGLEPAIRDPIDLAIADITGKLNYIAKARQLKEATAARHVVWGEPGNPPAPGFTQLDGAMARKTQTFPVPGPSGPVMTSKQLVAYGAPGFHESWNNMMDVGVRKGRDLLEIGHYAGNVSTMIKLIDPTFHMQVVGIGSVAGHVATGMEELGRGRFLDAMKSLAGSPLAPVKDFIKGRASTLRYLDPNNPDPIVQMMAAAGQRFAQAGTYQEMGKGLPSLYQSLDRGTFVREVKADFGKLWDTKEYTTLRNLARLPQNLGGLISTEAGRVASLVSSPVFKHMIPYMQIGGNYKAFDSWLRANPTASEAAQWAKMRDIVRDGENRMGELNMDNEFIPKAIQQGLGATMMSTSWTYGTARGWAAALGYDISKGEFRFNPRSLSALAATGITFALANSLAQFFHTGELPKDPMDAINYRTGGTFKGKFTERGMVPSEFKEAYDIGTIAAMGYGNAWSIPAGLAAYAFGKVNPMIQFAASFTADPLVGPKDRVGHALAYRPGAMQRAFAESFQPVFMNSLDLQKKGSALSPFELFMGEKQAPSWIQDWGNYQQGVAGARNRVQQQETSRARREDAENANPSGYDIPAAGGGGRSRGGGGGSRSRSGGYRDPRQ
jgi:hypothetical protein